MVDSIERQARRIWDTRAKVPASLGRIETAVTRLCVIQNTLTPKLENPVLILACADHGVSLEGVTSSSPSVTGSMMRLFEEENGCCALLCRANGMKIEVEDVGIGEKRSADFTKGPAFRAGEARRIFERGKQKVLLLPDSCDAVVLGEMGCGNTTVAGAIMASLTDSEPYDCFVRTSDCLKINEKKMKAIEKGLEKRGEKLWDILDSIGGAEIIFLAGVSAGAFERGIAVLNDGFMTSVAILIASKICPHVTDNVIACHCTDSPSHGRLLNILKLEPVCEMKMHPGEGSGALFIIPLIRQGLFLFNNLKSLYGANVDGTPQCRGLVYALGTTSYILQDDIIPNVEFLKDKTDDVELVLFESAGYSNLPSEEVMERLRETASENNLSYTVHLPYDVKACSSDETERRQAVATWLKVISLTKSLPVHGWIVHFEPQSYENCLVSADEESWRKAMLMSIKDLSDNLPSFFDLKKICVETLNYDIMPYLQSIVQAGFSLTLDVGHLWRNGFYSPSYVRALMPYTRIIHLHGFDGKSDHRSLADGDMEKTKEFIGILREYERQNIVLTLEVFSRTDYEKSLEVLRLLGAY